jgi:hypothetical protein
MFHCGTDAASGSGRTLLATVVLLISAAVPVAAAEIEGIVVPPATATGGPPPVQAIRRIPGSLQVVAQQESAADGRFAFSNLPAGEYWVATASPDGGNRWLPGDRPCIDAARCRIAVSEPGRELAANETWSGLVLRPDTPAVARGTVHAAEDGSPIERARVEAAGGEGWTLTDSQGRYRLGGFNPGRVGLRVTAPGRIGEIYPDLPFDPLFPDEFSAPHTLRAGDNPGLDYDLDRGSRLVGSLRARDSGAEIGDVQLWRSGGATRTDVRTFACDDPARARTGGCFDIDGLFPGTYTLVFADRARLRFAAGYYPDQPCGERCFFGGGTPVTVTQGQLVNGLHGTVVGLRGVRGMVRSAIDGQPLAGATVIAVQPQGAFGLGASVERARIRTGADGRFVIDDLPAGPLDLVVRSVPVHVDTRWPSDACTPADLWCTRFADAGRIVLPATGWVNDLELTPGVGSAIAGVVRTEKALPLPDATVWLVDMAGGAAVSRTTRTDALGRYAFDGLPPLGTAHLAVRNGDTFAGVVHHPDRWCPSSACGDVGGTPVGLAAGQVIEADFVVPTSDAFADSFEPAAR